MVDRLPRARPMCRTASRSHLWRPTRCDCGACPVEESCHAQRAGAHFRIMNKESASESIRVTWLSDPAIFADEESKHIVIAHIYSGVRVRGLVFACAEWGWARPAVLL